MARVSRFPCHVGVVFFQNVDIKARLGSWVACGFGLYRLRSIVTHGTWVCVQPNHTTRLEVLSVCLSVLVLVRLVRSSAF